MSYAAFHHHRQGLHLSILLNFSENRVNYPDQCYVRKLSPDRKIVIAISQNQLNVEIYRFRGSSAGNQLYKKSHKCADAKNQLFEAFFVKVCSIPVVSADMSSANISQPPNFWFYIPFHCFNTNMLVHQSTWHHHLAHVLFSYISVDQVIPCRS